MQTPIYAGTSASSKAAAVTKPMLALGLGVSPPRYTGDPGTGSGQQGAPKVVKRVTFTVLSPQLSSGVLADPSPSRSRSATASGLGPVAKSQPVVIAVPDRAKSYAIVSGFLAYPASATSGVTPPIPSAAPVGLDQPAKADLADGDAQVEITIAWMLLPGASAANAGDYKTLLAIEFYE